MTCVSKNWFLKWSNETIITKHIERNKKNQKFAKTKYTAGVS